MLTFFAIPKPFTGNNRIIQRNAVRSWLALEPAPEVILFGNDAGVAETAMEFRVRHVADVQRSAHGTPLVSSIFSLADGAASNDWLCYVNSDIIFFNDFLRAVAVAKDALGNCLIIGRRTDLDLEQELDYSSGWRERLISETQQRGTLHSHTGIDFFIYPKGLYKDMPPFAIGRSAWDNWLVYHASRAGFPLVDISDSALVIHENHDYHHVKGGATEAWKGQEAQVNQTLSGGLGNLYTIRDCGYGVVGGRVVKRTDPVYATYRWMVSKSRFKGFFSRAIKYFKEISSRF
jgi:hypothetical protein